MNTRNIYVSPLRVWHYHKSCVAFEVSSLHVLGHLVDSQRICPLEEKVTAIQDFPQPVTKHEFLGLINFHFYISQQKPDIRSTLDRILLAVYLAIKPL